MQGKVLLGLANLQHVAIDRAHLLQAREALPQRMQREHRERGHQRGQQQDQGKTDGQFLRRAEIGQTPAQQPQHDSPPP